MVVGCGIGCDHGQMRWNDAIMHVERPVKCGAMWCRARCGSAKHNVANI